MKKTVFIGLALLGAATVKAQQKNVQMIPPVEFRGSGSILLADSSTVTGTILYEAIFPNKVNIIAGGSGKWSKYNRKEVIRFNIGNSLWFSREIGDALATNSYSFINLVSDSASPIKLYEYHEQDAINPGGLAAYTKTTYIELPENGKLYRPSNLYFMPFNKKMAAIVATCPELAKKVADKQDGYTVKKMLGMPVNLEAMVLKVVTEYNACARTTAAQQ